MLRAIIFDFNGIILDDEPLHYESMRNVAASLGISLSREDYWNRYLPFDDKGCLDAICKDHSLQLSESQRAKALGDKSEFYHRMLQDRYPLFPGVADFVRAAASKYPLAIASGAKRDDIERTLRASGLGQCFRVIVGAEDFTLGKPHPESFLLALDHLNARLNGQPRSIEPHECMVVEDSTEGVKGARAAGMVCLAVSNTYPQERLAAASLVVSTLTGLDLATLERLCEEAS